MCPNKDKCPQFARPGQPNTLNVLSHMLLYMQGLQGKSNSELKDQITYKVWSSGYTACDTILSTLQDLKKGGNELSEYEKIRIQYVNEKYQRDQE